MAIDDPKVAEVKAIPPMGPPIGVTGLRAFSGYIREEFLTILTGKRGAATFEEMSLNDATCGAILFAIKNLLRAVKWRVEPAIPDDPRADEAALLLEGMLFKDMSTTWPEFIESISSMFVYGYSVNEIVWKKRNGYNAKPWLDSQFDDGLWAPESFSPRSQKTIERWIYDEDNHLLGFVQYPYDRPVINVPIERCLHFTTTAELENPEGRSVLRTAYRSWYWSKRLQEIEGIGSERDLAGYPVLTVPGDMLDPNATPDQRIALAGYEDMVRKVRRDQNEGIIIPSDRDEHGNPFYEFKLMSSGGARAIPIGASIERYQKDIARSVLADFIFLGADGGGSLALGVEKVDVFVTALQGYAQSITAEINKTAVAKIWRINGLDPDLRPSLVPEELTAPDLAGMASYVQALSTIGYNVGADTELEQHLRRIAELPPAPDDDGSEDVPDGAAELDQAAQDQAIDDELPSGKPTKTTVTHTFDRAAQDDAEVKKLEQILKARAADPYAALRRLAEEA